MGWLSTHLDKRKLLAGLGCQQVLSPRLPIVRISTAAGKGPRPTSEWHLQVFSMDAKTLCSELAKGIALALTLMNKLYSIIWVGNKSA
jgi:hypothetical protein